MNLTLNIEQSVVENAEIYAKYAQKSISQLVEEYLLSISSKNRTDDSKSLGPVTAQLTGIIRLDKSTSSKELLTEALAEKYL